MVTIAAQETTAFGDLGRTNPKCLRDAPEL